VFGEAEGGRITLRMRLPPRNRANVRLGEPPPEPASSRQVKLQDTFELTNTANMVINPTYLAQRTRSCMHTITMRHWGL
jgi:NADH dehydrogenase (ubiquinone) 1 alpha subcomplex subunit 6